ncbi:HIT domain-containing protein [Pelagibacteraceae bacterium]|nr:HIT domain-containing protein [Pelagibacteraceae bacterium]
MYDKNNIFAKILREELPCEKVFEDEISLFFKDINPQAKIHILGIPKLDCVDLYDFIKKSDDKFFISFYKNINLVLEKLNVVKNGYRIISNSGINGGQEVPHFHIHILAGEQIGSLR